MKLNDMFNFHFGQ